MPKQSACVLWTRRRDLTMSPGTSCRRCFRRMGRLAHWCSCTDHPVLVQLQQDPFLVGVGLCQGCYIEYFFSSSFFLCTCIFIYIHLSIGGAPLEEGRYMLCTACLLFLPINVNAIDLLLLPLLVCCCVFYVCVLLYLI